MCLHGGLGCCCLHMVRDCQSSGTVCGTSVLFAQGAGLPMVLHRMRGCQVFAQCEGLQIVLRWVLDGRYCLHVPHWLSVCWHVSRDECISSFSFLCQELCMSACAELMSSACASSAEGVLSQ